MKWGAGSCVQGSTKQSILRHIRARISVVEAAYKSTPFKPKTRVKYKGRWYRVRKRHQTTCATGLLYQLRPVGGGTSAARAAEEPSAGLQALLAAAAAEDCEDDHVTGTKRDRELS